MEMCGNGVVIGIRISIGVEKIHVILRSAIAAQSEVAVGETILGLAGLQRVIRIRCQETVILGFAQLSV